MSSRAENPVPPVFSRPRDVDGGDITAAIQDGVPSGIDGSAGETIAAKPSRFRAEA